MPEVPHSVLVICFGNICRSPVGEFLLKKYAGESDLSEVSSINFDSAGMHAGNGRMSSHSVKYLNLIDINTDGFRAKPVSREFLDQYDLILVMETYMIQEILEYYYHDLDSEQLQLREMQIIPFTIAAGCYGDIEDPYGESWRVYKGVLDQINEHARNIVNRWTNSNHNST
ncbi:MAG: arsenate-mycothiol transferase ArsC [Promethearchaeota archaeon]